MREASQFSHLSTKHNPPPTSPAKAAHLRTMHRLFQAFIREGFLNPREFIVENNVTWIPLSKQQHKLRVEGLTLGRAGHVEVTGGITHYQPGHPAYAIDNATDLLDYVLVDARVDSENRQRLRYELANSTENAALYYHFRQQWQQELQWHLRECGQSSLLLALLDPSNPISTNPCLFLEQWGCLGHPFHPAHKSKPGLSAEQVVALSPEFRPELQLVFGALKKALAKVSSVVADVDYSEWVSKQYPEQMAAWTRALQESGENPQDWVPLPIHPYQAQQILPQKFEREIDARQLLIDHNLPHMRASPTMSFRTVACSANPLAPQMKLPAAIQMTSAQRTVSPRATVMGPRVSKLLREIIDRENGFEQTLAILPEDIGLHYIDPTGNADIEKHLSILYRQNPMTKATADQLPVPVAALFADSPLDGRPFAVELVTLAHGDHAAGAIAYFRDYAKITLRATLSAYLVYGIAFEAHQQNTLVLLNKNGKAGQIIFRDFGDIRIDASVLHAQGMHIENYQSGHVLFDEATAVREKFLHTTMLCNLAELAQMLARSYQQNEDIYWQSLFHTTATIFEELRIRCEPTRWERERQAILYADWPVKALLRMRLENTVDDICLSMPNPLAAFSVRQP